MRGKITANKVYFQFRIEEISGREARVKQSGKARETEQKRGL
jgi:hypothetical protein